MAESNNVEFMAVEAGEDLSSRQYHIINNAGTLAANSVEAVGSLYNKPDASGRPCQTAYEGVRIKGKAGAAIANNAPVMVTTSGWLITVTSGQSAVGRNMMGAAVNSGDIFSFQGDFSRPAFVNSY